MKDAIEHKVRKNVVKAALAEAVGPVRLVNGERLKRHFLLLRKPQVSKAASSGSTLALGQRKGQSNVLQPRCDVAKTW